jgi:hypothetical protein
MLFVGALTAVGIDDAEQLALGLNKYQPLTVRLFVVVTVV